MEEMIPHSKSTKEHKASLKEMLSFITTHNKSLETITNNDELFKIALNVSIYMSLLF
jgi:hypothetical protein